MREDTHLEMLVATVGVVGSVRRFQMMEDGSKTVCQGIYN